MASTWVLGSLLVILGIFVSDAGTGDPFANQARIVLQNGNLVLQSALNGNITLSSRGQGKVVVNGVDMGQRSISTQVSTGGGATNSLVYQKLLTQGSKLSDLTDQVNQLEENVTTISNRMNQFVGTGRDKISNSRIRRVMSRVQTLTDKVNTLTRLLTENECSTNPCRNGGTCVDQYNGFLCNCPPNWEGTTCDVDVNECARFAGTSFGCQNGATCVNTHGGYSCNCLTNWHGIHCTEKYDDCSTASHQELCGHGTCIDEKRAVPGQPKYRCICDAGWQKSSSSPACTEDIDECSGPNPRCSQNPPVSCINLPGSFHCGHCPAGYTGNGHTCTDINECETQNGGCSMQPFVQCSNTAGSRICGPCPAGYIGNGVQCTFMGVCSINRGGCHPLASCIENSAITGTYRECRCPTGYLGNGEGLNGCVAAAGMTCASNPCQHGVCQVVGESFLCVCNPGYHGTLCDREEIHVCASNPCQNGGTCVRQGREFTCVCLDTYEGTLCADRKSSSVCGEHLYGDNGTLSYTEPWKQGVTKNCAWVITVNPGQVVNITFDKFFLGQVSSCQHDFLQIHDGPDAGGRIISRYCRRRLEGESIVSTHNAFYLWLFSTSTHITTNFTLHWNAVDRNCGQELDVSQYGAVNSPGYPGKYPINSTCEWLVRVPMGQRIQFHFATLRMESHPNCSYDYLKIYDGATVRDPEIGTYCTTVTPAPLTTSGHSSLLVFHSDHSVQDTGFHITYSAQSSVQGCGGLLTNPSGTISSPNFPDVYDNNLNCEWLIRVNPDNRVKLVFKEFQMESHANCAFDNVEVYAGANDAAPLLGRFCGATVPPEIFANSNQVFIRLRSDNSLVYSGFKAEYRTICGGTFTEPHGVLSSPYYPDYYPAKTQCIYEIRLEQGYLINVTFHDMQIEQHVDCVFDYVQVRDGDADDSPLIGQFCGNRAPENIISTFNYLWMKFETDGSVQNLGFYAEYDAIEVGCGGVLTEMRGQISTPRHPDLYPHSTTCSWYLKAPEGYIVRLTFTSFALEHDSGCKFDHVLVQDVGGKQIGRYCGNQKPPILTSMDSSMFVSFVTDSSVAREGFTAKYEFLDAAEACGGTFYQESGVIRSPGYPNRYPHSAHCVWILKGVNHRQITLNATAFELESHANCRYDFLEIRNGGYETSPLIDKYCGTYIQSPIKSHSNVLRLEFKTDASMSAPGFEIFFDSTATGCGGKMTSPRGTIVSPNYPQAYPFNADCEWLIQVSAGSVISLSVIDIDIEEHRECRYDYVQVFDGSTESSKSLLRICNNQQNTGAIVSSGSSLLVRFRSDFSEVAGGFQLSYQTLCNNKISGKRRGVIESPNFPNTYPHNHNCTWTVEVPNGSNISFSFSHFFMEGGDNCSNDYVEVVEVNKVSGYTQQLGKFCGNDNSTPTTLTTATNIAYVRLVTDRSVAREGFRLEWRQNGCGGELVDKMYGAISSPNFPNGYPHMTTCYWYISTVLPGSQVELTVTDLDLENDVTCRYDYLRVFGGEDEQSPRLLNMCSAISQPTVVTSHGNHMVVKFNTDLNVERSGFRATFRIKIGGCGGTFKAFESTIMSPNFPESYSNSDDCSWLIQVDSTHLVVLDFYEFELPQSVDCTMGYVAIYDGDSIASPLVMKHCGGKPEGSIYSTGNQMLVKLVADGVNAGKGFKAHYRTGCGQRLLADAGGVITSLNYPHFAPDQMNCSWIIYASEPGEKVSLIVTNMNLPVYENCTYSSLRFMDGDMPDSPIIGEYCGKRSPPPIISRGSIMHVFLLNFGIFRATYGMASTHCGGDYNSAQGTFGSPGYPSYYDRDMECVWTVTASPGNRVHLSFEFFNLEDSDHCNKDYLEIHENDVTGPLIGRYCGNRIPTNVTAASKLWIKFRSDEIDTQAGFLAHYELQHGNVLNGTGGLISSPGYPQRNPMSDQSRYVWSVNVPSGMFVSIRFIEIGIGRIDSEECADKRVQIHDGFDENAPILGQFCGFQVPDSPVVSTGSVVFIIYFTTQYYPSSFMLEWVAVSDNGIVVQNPEPTNGDTCWEEITLNVSDSMSIMSPNYPRMYPPNLNCTYIVRAPHYQHVDLNIVYLQMEDFAPTCHFDRLEVYYMSNPYVNEWQLNSTLCGTLNDTTLSSPTNLMKLVLITDKYESYKGFEARARSNCGVRLTGQNGALKSDYIYSDMRSVSHSEPFQCEYFITVRSKRTIQISWQKFNFPSDSICNSNYILVRNGGSRSSPILAKYCGSTVPPLLETSSNEVYVQVVVGSLSSGVPDFEMRYSELSFGCGGQLFLTEDIREVEFSSPNYPNPPVHDTECEWVIVSPAGTRMRIDFDSEFHMSPDCMSGDHPEYLDIHDGGTEMSPPLYQFCGHEQPSSVMSSGNALYARYVTAVETPQAGFKARISTAVCGGTILDFHGVIESPNFPLEYGNSQECVWLLKMPLGYRIYLSITELNTPPPLHGLNCTSTDYLEIRDYDEQGEVLSILCGDSVPQQITTPSSQAYIKFKSNSGVTAKGFHLWLRGIVDTSCGGWLEASEGVITSPNFPNALPAARNCQWRLMAPEGRRLKITFTEFNLPRVESSGICLSSLRATSSSRWRHGGGTEMCGSTLPAPILSESGYFTIDFLTHGLSAGQGFSLSYNSDEEGLCGGVLTQSSGVIASPANISVENGSSLDCRWKISLDYPNNVTVVFRFDVLDLPGVMANYCMDGILYIIGGKRFMGRYCGNYSEEVVFTSPYSVNNLRLLASLDKPMRGVRGTYNVSNCGGTLSGEVEISSPGYPNEYPPNTVCHWHINVPEGETMVLSFDDLRLEDDCSKDYILVRNGHHDQSPILGKFCGNHAPVPITSSGNVLTLIFHTDAYGSAPGFKATTKEQQRGCGGLIHSLVANISSPNHPSHYENNVECRWIIEYVPGYIVRAEFIGRFDIEMGTSCNNDYLLFEQFEENDNSWSVIDKKCGRTTPPPLVTTSRKMRITFHSNERITGDGFLINYTATCGGNFTQPRGTVMSPNYPSFYDKGLNCAYNIGKAGQYISLTFDDYFSLEGKDDCRYDNILLVSGNTTNSTVQGPYCGTEKPFSRTLKGPVTVKFVTDESYNAHGFKLNYEILDCGATLTDATGVIETPKTPLSSMFEMDCSWKIVAPSQKVIVLRFTNFDLTTNYNCWGSYLDIRDGLENGALIGKLCGNSTPIVKSTGNTLSLKLHINVVNTHNTFSAFYHVTYGPAEGCGGTLNEAQGEIQSLDSNSDGFYEYDLDCRWLIRGDDEDHVYKITFEWFDLEPSPNETCIYDYVMIREDLNEDSSLIGMYCGAAVPQPIITSGNMFSVLFHSDYKNNNLGFKLKFESVPSPCGPSALVVVPGVPQMLNSPNYPTSYAVNLRCRWTITRNVTGSSWRQNTVQMTFLDLDIPCDGDYIEVQKIKPPKYSRQPFQTPLSTPIKLCGPTQVHDVIGPTGMTLVMHSDSKDNAARGFSLEYKEASCNRSYTRDSGVIFNSGYPGRRNSAQVCSMNITTTPGRTISAYFSRLEMYDQRTVCSTSYFKVYDGPDKTSPLLGTYCGYDTPDPIFSTGNQLYFEASMPNFAGLYYITYMTTDQDRGCGGSIYAEKGTFSSPLYPSSYSREAECVWYISVPGYHNMLLQFKVFSMNSTSGCDSNYVEIYEGRTTDATVRVVRYCGSDFPDTYLSTSNAVTVKFKSDIYQSGPGFIIDFSSLTYLADTSTPFIQRNPENEISNNVIYLK